MANPFAMNNIAAALAAGLQGYDTTNRYNQQQAYERGIAAQEQARQQAEHDAQMQNYALQREKMLFDFDRSKNDPRLNPAYADFYTAMELVQKPETVALGASMLKSLPLERVPAQWHSYHAKLMPTTKSITTLEPVGGATPLPSMDATGTGAPVLPAAPQVASKPMDWMFPSSNDPLAPWLGPQPQQGPLAFAPQASPQPAPPKELRRVTSQIQVPPEIDLAGMMNRPDVDRLVTALGQSEQRILNYKNEGMYDTNPKLFGAAISTRNALARQLGKQGYTVDEWTIEDFKPSTAYTAGVSKTTAQINAINASVDEMMAHIKNEIARTSETVRHNKATENQGQQRIAQGSERLRQGWGFLNNATANTEIRRAEYDLDAQKAEQAARHDAEGNANNLLSLEEKARTVKAKLLYAAQGAQTDEDKATWQRQVRYQDRYIGELRKMRQGASTSTSAPVRPTSVTPPAKNYGLPSNVLQTVIDAIKADKANGVRAGETAPKLRQFLAKNGLAGSAMQAATVDLMRRYYEGR